jgi:hypothetical protein
VTPARPGTDRLLAILEDFRLLPFFVLVSMAIGIGIGKALSISDFVPTPPIDALKAPYGRLTCALNELKRAVRVSPTSAPMSAARRSQMNRRTGSVTQLVLTALLVGVAAVGCAGNSGTGNGRQVSSAPTAPSAPPAAQTDQAQTPEITPTVTDTAAPGSNGNSATSGTSDVTTPQIDTQLKAIDQALSNLNGSLSGADAGPSAGE